MGQDQKDQLGRRQFFRALGGGTVAAAAGMASPISVTEAQAYDPGRTRPGRATASRTR